MKHSFLLIDITSACMILLFTGTAYSKIAGFQHFQLSLYHFPFITGSTAAIAALVIAIECIIVALLLFPAYRIFGLRCTALLLAAFTAYLILMLSHAKDIPCACGGLIKGMSWPLHIAFNTFWILIIITALIIHHIGHAQSQQGGY